MSIDLEIIFITLVIPRDIIEFSSLNETFLFSKSIINSPCASLFLISPTISSGFLNVKPSISKPSFVFVATLSTQFRIPSSIVLQIKLFFEPSINSSFTTNKQHIAKLNLAM